MVLAHSVASSVGHITADCKADYTTETEACQDVISKLHQIDITEKNELEKKFAPKRKTAELLSESYRRIGFENKAQSVAECGTVLEFIHEIKDGHISEKGKLHGANFCKDRLCPLCSWRRTLKIFSQVSDIMKLIGTEYDFLFLTLTVPSVSEKELSPTLDRMFKAWYALSHRRRFLRSIKGFFRVLEITRNNKQSSKSYGLYHPHFHCILAVDKRYFKEAEYIKRDEWLDMWQACYKDNSITQVDVRRARNKYDPEAQSAVLDLSSAVAEIAKYSVKSSDYIFSGDDELTDRIVTTLSNSLRNRRLSAYGGCFKESFEKLQLDDAEDGDLVHIGDEFDPSLAYIVIRYRWNVGCYLTTDIFKR